MRLPLIVLTIAISASAAEARPPAWCIEGLETGDETLLRNNVDRLLNQPDSYTDAEVELAARCLKAAQGFDYGYDPVTRKFVTVEQLELEKQRRAEEAVKQAQEDAVAAQAAEAAARKAARQAAVARRLSEGCHRMYRRDPDATITNQLCFDVFWAQGLPD